MPAYLVVALLFLPAFAGFGAIGQTVIGTVEKVSTDQLQVKGPNGPVTLHLDEKARVRKGKVFHDLSALVVGDEVRVNYYGEEKLTAVNVSAKVELSGVITEAGPIRIVVLPASTPDAKAPDRKTVFVFLDRTTKFGTSRSQLAVGRRIQVVGWDAGDGVVDAERVAIYDTDLPTRRMMPKQ